MGLDFLSVSRPVTLHMYDTRYGTGTGTCTEYGTECGKGQHDTTVTLTNKHKTNKQIALLKE